LRPLLGRDKIEAMVGALARRIQHDYRGKDLLILGTLKGSFIFLADLVRRLDIPLEVDFVQVQSYAGTSSTGRCRVVLPLSTPIRGRDVLVVEDIVDTGLSADCVMKYIKRKKPLSLRLCAIFDKPSRRQVRVHVDYRGFELPDEFVVGYGLDCDQLYRNLPDLYALEQK
jgi:hypoxanthine phosphoribosyltransferase